MTRRILITLGSTTDGERCGGCDRKDGALCMLFGEVLAMARAPIPPPTRGFKLVATRLPECLAAEKEAANATFSRSTEESYLTGAPNGDDGSAFIAASPVNVRRQPGSLRPVDTTSWQEEEE